MHKWGRTVCFEGANWINKAGSDEKASTTHDKMFKAIDAAIKMLRSEGGGELVVKGEDGSIKDISLVKPSNSNGYIKYAPFRRT